MVLCDGQVVHRTRPLRNTALRLLSLLCLVHRVFPAARLVVSAETPWREGPGTTHQEQTLMSPRHNGVLFVAISFIQPWGRGEKVEGLLPWRV